MPGRCLLCYITDRKQFSVNEVARQQQLLQKISDAAHAGVDFVQLREKDLNTRDLEQLARKAVEIVRRERDLLSGAGQGPGTRLLINSRSDVAIAVGADGVHLRSDDISVTDARTIWSAARTRTSKLGTENWIVSVSCHSEADVRQAASEHPDFAVFAPVFAKKDAPDFQPAGIDALRKACQHHIPVLALGGVTLENAESCLRAGAAGIAGIRLFQEDDIFAVVRSLRGEAR